ncbi:hypothetical protein K493DRAFT_18303 [Basidiobolus meristosporus CBS 931.73]|uniref:UBP-type domain-containing protein n=1 Tax=Basidiobolus meristosporus CBS 931.73 TaxID=1314790 RepID=A0A1Y1Z8Z0_9FUNG|nr:hypothetical protein K493DRAFT_18303 [Basidiobolus meristosporus CBS 931.73]|eukprot:ORY06574.1 hypothetical protein K493DRAFT_18303 [Basidiobolus meristosporus CBS 931.73]
MVMRLCPVACFPLLSLPYEILVNILSNLQHADLLNCSLVCKVLNNVSKEDSLWFGLCCSQKNINFKPPYMSWRELFTTELHDVCTHLSQFNQKHLEEKLAQYVSLVDTYSHLSCSSGDCTETVPDLWICANKNCQFLGCGRWRGAHALDHFKSTGHALSFKINTTELWCYRCNRWMGTNCSDIETCRVNEIMSLMATSLPSLYKSEEIARRRKERSISMYQQFEVGYFVEQGWMTQWQGFVLGNNPAPGPITNHRLLTEQGSLNPDLVLWEDYSMISQEAWKQFQQIYGGGPALDEGAIDGPQYVNLRRTIKYWKIEYLM